MQVSCRDPNYCSLKHENKNKLDLAGNKNAVNNVIIFHCSRNRNVNLCYWLMMMFFVPSSRLIYFSCLILNIQKLLNPHCKLHHNFIYFTHTMY